MKIKKGKDGEKSFYGKSLIHFYSLAEEEQLRKLWGKERETGTLNPKELNKLMKDFRKKVFDSKKIWEFHCLLCSFYGNRFRTSEDLFKHLKEKHANTK